MTSPLNSLPDGEPLAAIIEGLSADEQYKFSCRLERVLIALSKAQEDPSRVIDVCATLAQCADVLGHPDPEGSEKFNALCDVLGVDVRITLQAENPADPENKTLSPLKLFEMAEAIREKAEALMKDEK